MVQGFKGRSTVVGDDSDGGRRSESRIMKPPLMCSSVEAATATLSALKKGNSAVSGEKKRERTDGLGLS